MRNEPLVIIWLKRAKSNLQIAKAGKVFEDILYEDLCFDCEQAVEKALKALLVSIDVSFPRTHSISHLIELIEENGIISWGRGVENTTGLVRWMNRTPLYKRYLSPKNKLLRRIFGDRQALNSIKTI